MMARATGAKSGCSRRMNEDVLQRTAPLREVRETFLGDDSTSRQDDDARAESFDHVEAMGTEEDHLPFRRQHPKQGAKEQPRVHVKAGERLVEHEQLRIVEQCRRQQNTLPHPLRVRVHRPVAAVVQLKQLQKPRDAWVEPRRTGSGADARRG